MEQVILDHYSFIVRLKEEQNIISLFGLFPNFIFMGKDLISSFSLYHSNDEDDECDIWINGKMEGIAISLDHCYHRVISRYQNGIQEGIEKTFNSDDSLVLIHAFRNGKLNGPSEGYYRNFKTSIGNYLNNKREGFWEFRYNDGTMKKSGNYKEGEKIGEWKNWDKDGVLNITYE